MAAQGSFAPSRFFVAQPLAFLDRIISPDEWCREWGFDLGIEASNSLARHSTFAGGWR
jgi:hypothetical protein